MSMFNNIRIPKEEYIKTLKHEAGHYLALRACDIIPTRVEFKIINFETDTERFFGFRGCTINPANTFFETLKEASTYTYCLAINSVAGAFAGQLDEETKKINKDLAIKDFMNLNSAKSDYLPFIEDLKLYIACSAKDFENIDITHKDCIEVVKDMIFDDTIGIIEDNAKELIELKNFFHKKITECNTDTLIIENSEIEKEVPSVL